MPNDAKLGLLAGVAATLVVAVVYFHKPALGTGPPAKVAVAGVGNAPPAVPPAAVKVPSRPSGVDKARGEE